MSDVIRIAIVDDHPLLLEGVASFFANADEFEIVGTGSNADEAVKIVVELLPDIILLDVSMPGSGINAAAQISAEFPFVRIGMLTVSENDDDVYQSFKAGAFGYILKGISGTQLINVVREMHKGERYVSPNLAAKLLSDNRASAEANPAPQADLLGSLSWRENQILELIAEGKNNREIGEAINLAEKTVKNYTTNIFHKLQVRNRVEAALMAKG